jgi:hypothetical protein
MRKGEQGENDEKIYKGNAPEGITSAKVHARDDYMRSESRYSIRLVSIGCNGGMQSI